MPNHCSNTLRVVAPDQETKEKIREVLLDTEREDEDLTCENLLPRPDEIDQIHSGSAKIDGQRWERWREVETEDGTERKPLTQADRQRLKQEYGADGPLEWSRINWGTKWDCYWSTLEKEDETTLEFSFTTAWKEPGPFLEKLRDEFPSVRFRLEYHEPNMDIEGVL